MNWSNVVTVDFETEAIKQRPEYPPRPTGVAIKWGAEPSHYFAFGHPTGNNCTPDQAHAALRKAWESGLPICAFNQKFDFAVAKERAALPWPAWQQSHDPMFLAYLCDPHARSLALKSLAADLLQWPATEKNELDDWIWAHREQIEQTWGERVTKRQLGAHIARAPGQLVAPYACGDVDRTYGLLQHLGPLVEREGMLPAYLRELQLCPILAENEETGMRTDLPGLEGDIEAFDISLERVENWLRNELKASGLNFDADADVASVLLQRGIVPEDKWTRTKATKAHPNGVLSMSKEALLPEYFTDPRIASALGYRNRLVTCLKMFMVPWQEQAAKRNGYISCTWNQVRNPQGGTRTGRPSTQDPNLLNISKDFDGRDDGYVHPAFLGLPKLPLVRKYILPDEGHVFLHRDFDGQELRVFADYEQGALWQQYQADPMLDPHKFVGEQLMAVAGRKIERTAVKAMNFQGLYGGGVPALQRKLRCSYAEAKELKAFHNKALPGREAVNKAIKRIVATGEPIRTWGGRIYYPETARQVDGRWQDFVYKLINYAVQGSAADLTKQTLIDWHDVPWRTSRFMVTVYDEINISCPVEHAGAEMKLLKDVMEADRLTVPMRSSGKSGPSWGELQKCA